MRQLSGLPQDRPLFCDLLDDSASTSPRAQYGDEAKIFSMNVQWRTIPLRIPRSLSSRSALRGLLEDTAPLQRSLIGYGICIDVGRLQDLAKRALQLRARRRVLHEDTRVLRETAHWRECAA